MGPAVCGWLLLQVQFLTTGQGKWRANPNLYAEGKASPDAHDEKEQQGRV